jgi:hypothetical protein
VGWADVPAQSKKGLDAAGLMFQPTEEKNHDWLLCMSTVMHSNQLIN